MIEQSLMRLLDGMITIQTGRKKTKRQEERRSQTTYLTRDEEHQRDFLKGMLL